VDGKTVVSLTGVTIITENGETVATSSKGKRLVTVSAADTRDINALTASFDTNRHVFDANAAEKSGASKQSIADASTVLAAAGWTVRGSVTGTASTMAVMAASSCRGFNGYHGLYFPWGTQYGLNSCNTTKLIADVAGGAGSAGLIATILAVTGVGGVTAGVIAAILAFGAGALGVCQGNSNIGAIWLNLSGVPPVSCWSQ
jgi:hypothetical protein